MYSRFILSLAVTLILDFKVGICQETSEQINYIRKVFKETTELCESISPNYLRLDTLRPDGATEFRQWIHHDQDIKFQLTEYKGKDKRVSDFYFGDGGLIFAFTQDFLHDELGNPYVRENRYYFKDEDTLIRWLDKDKNEVNPNSEGFKERGYDIWADMHSSGETFFMFSRVTDDAASDRDNYVINPEGFYGITFNRPVSDFYGQLKKGVLRTGDGEFDVYNIQAKNGEELGHLFFDEMDKSIESIEVTSPRARMQNGIVVGASHKKFKEMFPKAEVGRSEIESRLLAHSGKFTFVFDNYDLNDPGKIKSIIVWR